MTKLLFSFLGVAPLCVAAPFRARYRSVLRTAAYGGTLQAANAKGWPQGLALLLGLLCAFTQVQAQCQQGDCQNGPGTYRFPSGTQFQLSCDGIAGGNCYSSVLTLNYLPANDPSCQQGQQTYQCSDGLDNDNDGFIDFVGSPNAPVGAIPDPGCVSLIDNSEFNLKVKVKEN